MKNVYKYALIASALLSLAACNNLIEPSEMVDVERTITLIATREGTDPNTRSVRMEDGTTWWGPKEEISVFYGSGTNGGSKFTSNNTTLVETTEFEGSIAMSGNKEFWAVYPYSSENSCDGSSVVTVIPSQQTGSEGNFADDAFPAIGKSSSLTMPFWNICGGIKFFVSRTDIQSITVKGNRGEAFAGKVRVAFDADGHPEVTEIIDGKTEVTLVAPDGGSFKPGKYYYVTLLPTALDGGITLTFYTSSEKGEIVSDKAQTVKRSIFGVLKNIDSKVAEWKSTEPEAVDLGLSVKWASFNLGATGPEEYGDYFAWGETEPKPDYSWATYKFELGTNYEGPFSKYVTNSKYGTVDNKTILDPEDDAARASWGGNWRMPTAAEWDELSNSCYWIWTSDYNGTGIAGMIVSINESGDPDKSVFIPASGRRDGTSLIGAESGGFYWSSSLDASNPYCAYDVLLSSGNISRFPTHRSLGRSVRPVYDDRIHPESVSLNKSRLSLYVGGTEQLMASVLPADATDQSVSWSSDNFDVATVDIDGNVTAVAAGSAMITVTTIDGGLTASCEVTVINPEPEYVDLGLSVKWATFNVGATKPEDYGDYFAWGETESKEDYSWPTYKWCNGSFNNLTKYCPSDYAVFWGGSGSPDNKLFIDLVDDAASVNWGENWRMPTDAEWTELRENCTWSWTNNSNWTGIAGIDVISNKTGYEDKSIFLPAAGSRYRTNLSDVSAFGYYWSSSLNFSYADRPYHAWSVYFSSGAVTRGDMARYVGYSVRPVYDDRIHPESIALNKSSMSLFVGDSEQIIATISPTNVTDKTVIWMSDNTAVATVDENGNVTAVAEGSTTVTAYASNGLSASCDISVKVFTSVIDGHEAVDLGLPSGLKWATINVGVTKPSVIFGDANTEEYGEYYAWGETEPKSGYYWSSYKWCNGDDKTLTKYCIQSSYWDSSDPMDNKTILDPEDDAAHVNWGGSWRMPTETEWAELRDKCTWVWTVQSGMRGRLVTGPNGNSIFLPAAGYLNYASPTNAGALGFYWSSSLNNGSRRAFNVYFSNFFIYLSDEERCKGFSVRPVYGEFIPVSSVSLNETLLSLEIGSTAQLTATIAPTNATELSVRWVSGDDSIVTVDKNGNVTTVAEGTTTVTAYASNGLSAYCEVTVYPPLTEAGEKWKPLILA